MKRVFFFSLTLLFSLVMLTTSFTANAVISSSEETLPTVPLTSLELPTANIPELLPLLQMMEKSLQANVEFKIDVSFCEKGQLTLKVFTADTGSDLAASKLVYRWFVDGRFVSSDDTIECVCGRYALLFVVNMVDFTYGYQYVLLPTCLAGR